MPLKDSVAPLTYSRTLVQVLMLAGGVGLYSLLPVWKEHSRFAHWGDIPSQFHAALTLILGWLLVFRTNSGYGRWWEARTLWGSLINAIRNLSIKVNRLSSLTPDDATQLERLLSQYGFALRDHLRRIAYTATPSETESEPEGTEQSGDPMAIVDAIYAWAQRARADGKLGADELRVIDYDLAKLLEVCGGCERIARTPFVRSYRIFARQCIVLVLMTLPWGIVRDFHWWTVPLTVITAYFMLGMEIVAEHVEEPFGIDEDDLDLDGMCETMDASVRELFARSRVDSRNP